MQSKNLEARPTEYKGVRFGSKSEAVFARALDLAGVTWSYHPHTNGPHEWDFLVSPRDSDVSYLVEYKPVKPTKTYVEDINAKAKSEPKRCLILWGNPWDETGYNAIPLSSAISSWVRESGEKSAEAKKYRFDIGGGE